MKLGTAAGAGLDAADYLPRTSLLRLIGAVALSLLPHLLRLPLWESLLVVLLLLWRTLAVWRNWPMPAGWLKAGLTLATFAGVYLSFSRVSGQHAGVALLVAMLALKLTELRSRRDVFFIIFMLYFALVTHFLYSQEIWTVGWLLAAVVLITALLIDVNHRSGPLPARQALRLAVRMTAQALPLMMVMFVLFPRLPGPLWGKPEQTAARTGLSDSMRPGDIASLIQSDELAFRVRFEGPTPAASALYWRGPVLSHFDGRSWHVDGLSSARLLAPAAVELRGAALRYEMILEASQAPWLLALEMPDPQQLPADSRLNSEGQLLSSATISERQLLRGTAHLDFRFSAHALDAGERRRNLQLPDDGNPRARALASALRTQHGSDDAALMRALLQRIRSEPYHYALEVPRLGRHSVDEFLFDTQLGFCEHYASAFTFVMRAAGIPARVVTGYQGGERSPYGDYVHVRQSNAHAWSEVWLPGEGWKRQDPTAWIDPSRIDRSVSERQASFSERQASTGGLSWLRLKYMLEGRRDQLRAVWDMWILGYGHEQQQQLLGRFGIAGWRDLMVAMTATVSLLLALFGLWMLRQSLPQRNRDPIQRLWQRAQLHLRRHQLVQAPSEGPVDFSRRVIAARPELEAPMNELLSCYLRLRYGGDDSASGVRRLRQAVNRLIASTDRLRR